MSDFTTSIQKLEAAAQTLRDLDNVQFDTLPADKMALYLEPVERLVETWESLPGELTKALDDIRSSRDSVQRQQELKAWLDTLSPDELASVKAKMRAIFDNHEEVQ